MTLDPAQLPDDIATLKTMLISESAARASAEATAKVDKLGLAERIVSTWNAVGVMRHLEFCRMAWTLSEILSTRLQNFGHQSNDLPTRS